MKIVSWNCASKFREKYASIIEEDADIYVICECEDPAQAKLKEYVEFAGENYFWTGDLHWKGLGIFAKDNIKLEPIEGLNKEFKNFIALRVNDSFNLLGVWAMPPYVEMIHDYFDANTDLFDESLVICGDFNSNAVFNPKHKVKDRNGKAKNHSNLDIKLNNKGLFSIYHKLSGEVNGNETKFTFYQSKHLNVPFYLDYFYANEEIIKKTELINFWNKPNDDFPNKFEILDFSKWACLSDHLPIVFEINEL
ncbi:endonuclease/exonuclease/phosphatase family protein [uncultured Methanobrevibacter sp.]|uniref:endonuclease/exonuclease/phosphatase family protein n=1 Tax=uncultured Methanobrevibacter sp. TaxID=253161 RepID=UPI00320B6158